MKHIHPLIALTCLAFTLAACGDATTDDKLPTGTAPNSAANASNPQADSAGNAPQPSNGPSQPTRQAVTEQDDEPRGSDGVGPDALGKPVSAVGKPVSEEVDESQRTKIPGMSFVMPEGWKGGPEKPMRKATLVPPDEYKNAELSVFLFPGDVGGFGANITRWAGQVGIQFVKPPARSDYKTIEIDGVEAAWIPLIGEDRAILAIWVPIGENPDKPEQTWTLKMNCEAKDAEKLEPIVKAWAKSIKFENE